MILFKVEKHHNMKMSPKCAKALINVLKKHCPKYNKSDENIQG